MTGPGCERCKMRAKYDSNPQSWLARLWRWHAGWCPGWRRYMKSLPDDQRAALAGKYNMPKYK